MIRNRLHDVTNSGSSSEELELVVLKPPARGGRPHSTYYRTRLRARPDVPKFWTEMQSHITQHTTPSIRYILLAIIAGLVGIAIRWLFERPKSVNKLRQRRRRGDRTIRSHPSRVQTTLRTTEDNGSSEEESKIDWSKIPD
ncbi:hypothetical protein [Bactrocera dorsalis toti-like virus 1]|uniref:Uncharacterized protein n=1 Tax=Bactrocera dorsalis toti-like virus 1 TaxID=2760897 RepID=A0A7G4YW89_9VIRU|nr:hypothetical protein [Bactrocera dorsalis toti-like virus 1]